MNGCTFCPNVAVTFSLVAVKDGRPTVAACCWQCADQRALMPREKVPS
jgi:hypothetical protein